MASLLQRLKDRNLFQWLVAYLAGAWLFLEAFDLVAEQFEWPLWVRQGATIILLFGLLIAIVLAWNHGGRGRQRVNGGEVILVTLLLVLAGVSVTYFRGRSSELVTIDAATQAFDFNRDTPPERSVAVLPCKDLSPEGDQEYFASGLAEEITTNLAGISGLRVAARTSSFSFKDSGKDVATIAEALNVRNVIECSVRREGDRVRIAAQLVDAEEGFERWSSSYDRDVGSMLAVHGEIALAIAGALEAELRTGERSRLARRGTDNQEAYDLFLRGLSLHWKTPFAAENQFRALDYFRQAVAADSTFASGWAFLAVTYIGMGNLLILPPREAYSEAERAALRAVELDDELARGHFALGWVKLSYTFDWTGAEQEFRRTIALAPSEFTGYHGLNFALMVRGDFEEARAAAQEARSLDPLALWPRVGLFEVLYKMGDFEAIISDMEGYLEVEPNDPLFLADLALAQAHSGSLDDALAAAAKSESLAQGDPLITLIVANMYVTAGDTAAALERIERMSKVAEEGTAHVSAGLMALIYANIGDADRAFEWLDRAYDDYDSMMFSLHYPEFRRLRTDPRFGDLLDRLGLPKAAYR
jgi:adenylate cyclase